MLSRVVPISFCFPSGHMESGPPMPGPPTMWARVLRLLIQLFHFEKSPNPPNYHSRLSSTIISNSPKLRISIFVRRIASYFFVDIPDCMALEFTSCSTKFSFLFPPIFRSLKFLLSAINFIPYFSLLYFELIVISCLEKYSFFDLFV